MNKPFIFAVAALALTACDSEGIDRTSNTTGASSRVDVSTGGETNNSSADQSGTANQQTGGDNDTNPLGGSGSVDGGNNDINQFGGSGSGDGGNSTQNDSGVMDDDGENNGDTVDASLSLPEPTTGTTYVSTMSPIRSPQNKLCISPTLDENGNVVVKEGSRCPVVQFHDNLKFGDFILATNAWNFCASSLPDWQQCITVNESSAGITAGWEYDWGNERDVNGQVWLVKSYPEIIYGVKSPSEFSGPSLQETPAATGMPVRVDDVPFYKIDYAFSSERTTKRSKELNGQTIYGERNVAVESFFHELGGDCDVTTLIRNGDESNQRFEIMLWLDRGAERLPAAPSDFVTTVNLDGKDYDVYTKPSDKEYIAFVAHDLQTSGQINWNTFIEWTQTYSHRVNDVFKRGSDTVKLQDDWCMANILVGTEIWWGEENFQFDNWTIHRTVQ
jgi:hypothetical protein